MRSNVVTKDEFYASPTANDNVMEASWEVRRLRIAMAANEAANLPGNDSGDLEDFAIMYGLATIFA